MTTLSSGVLASGKEQLDTSPSFVPNKPPARLGPLSSIFRMGVDSRRGGGLSFQALTSSDRSGGSFYTPTATRPSTRPSILLPTLQSPSLLPHLTHRPLGCVFRNASQQDSLIRWVKVFPVQAVNLSLLSRTRVEVERESQLCKAAL